MSKVRLKLVVDTPQFTIQGNMKGRKLKDLGLSDAELVKFEIVNTGNGISGKKVGKPKWPWISRRKLESLNTRSKESELIQAYPDADPE